MRRIQGDALIAGFDPESRQRPLAIAGSLLACGGLYAGGWGLLALALGVMLLMLACVSARDGFLLLGPFATVEARRLARRDRVHFRRVMLMGGITFAVFVALGPDSRLNTGDPAARARFAEAAGTLTVGFGGVFALVVTILSVVAAAGVLSEERAAKRWDVLLATDLRQREIVFGKVMSRVVAVLLMAASALPVLIALSAVRLFPRELILPGAAFLAAASLAISGMAVRMSATRTAPGAISAAVFLAIGYLLASSALCSLQTVWPAAWAIPAVARAVEWANAANPITTVQFVTNWVPLTNEKLLAALPEAARRFAAGSLAVFLWGALGACRGLRRETAPRRTLAQRLGALTGRLLRIFGLLKRRQPAARRHAIDRPGVPDEPLAWWVAERDAPPSRRLAGPASRKALAVWFGVAFLLFCVSQPLTKGFIADALLVITLFAGVFSAIAAAARAARAVPEQRSGDTFETLRLTALTPRDIVTQVHAGALARYRRLLPRLAAVLAAAAIAGYVQWLPTAFYLTLAWLIPPAFVSWIVWMTCHRSSPGEAVRIGVVGGLGGHFATALAVVMASAFVWEALYAQLIGGRSIPLISEFLWWDWLIDPATTNRLGYKASYRSVGPIKFGRLVWPLGPAVGALLLAAIVYGYVRLSRLALRAAAIRLAGDWYAPRDAAV